MSTNSSPMFMSLERPQKAQRWGSFATSYVVQAIAVTALLVYTVIAPRVNLATAKHVDLVNPESETAPKAAKAKQVRHAARAKLEPALSPPVHPKIQAPVLQVQQPQRVRKVAEVAEIAQPQLAIPKFDSKVLTSLPKTASKIIATNTFGSSAAPSLQKIAPIRVQTGGFGDPNGVPGNAHGSNRSSIAATGAFDLPTGSGNGNGTGGSKGSRGTIASTGFGNGAATQPNVARTPQGHVQSSGFVNPTVTPSSDDSRRAKATHPGVSTPVSIQSKPSPVYTSEARQLRVEGEVLLNVVFAADGQIRVLNVVRGLGHGLDEAAQRAAKGVRFSPAMRDGHPVDSNATLHIVFQLS